MPFIDWWKDNCVELHYSEKIVVNHEMGYAGKLDCKANIKGHGTCIIDFKCRNPSKEGTIRVYDEDGYQLSAYMEADAIMCQRATKCLSILLSSAEPKMQIHEWDGAKLEHSYLVFTKITELWRLLKNYNPATGKKL